MLSAKEKGKDITNTCEDSLTSSVFDGLLLLPDEVFWRLLKKACPTLPDEAAVLEDYSFWPKYATDEIEEIPNEHFVEPDLVLNFESFDLIIEAKRWDGAGQNPEQWQNQLLAHRFHLEDDEKELYLLAIGGVDKNEIVKLDIDNEDDEPYTIFKYHWKSLLEAIHHELANTEETHNQKLFNYIIRAFALHGHIFVKIKYFDEILEQAKSYRPNFTASLNILNNWKIPKSTIFLKSNFRKLLEPAKTYKTHFIESFNTLNNWRIV
ncbi:MAG: hypothetical protein FWE37_03580 [Spirochaetaceae bacterium]|nr:hypothetical protein [Spirochaetaceae bacterium]